MQGTSYCPFVRLCEGYRGFLCPGDFLLMIEIEQGWESCGEAGGGSAGDDPCSNRCGSHLAAHVAAGPPPQVHGHHLQRGACITSLSKILTPVEQSGPEAAQRSSLRDPLPLH